MLDTYILGPKSWQLLRATNKSRHPTVKRCQSFGYPPQGLELELEQHPSTQLFYRVLVHTATFTSIGNQVDWGFSNPSWLARFNRVLVPFTAPTIVASQILYLIVHANTLTFDVFAASLSLIPVTGIVNIAIFSAKMNSFNNLMKNFLTKIHLHNYKDHHVLMRTNLLKIEHRSRWLAYYLIIFLMADWALWMVIPSVHNVQNLDNIRNGTVRLQTCLYVWLPVDYSYNFRNWFIIHSMCAYASCLGCVIIILYNIFMYMFVFHLLGHIVFLKYKIKTLFKDTLSDQEVKAKLTDVIEYHTFIISVFKDIQSAFGWNVTGNYLHNLLGDSIVLFQMMFGEKSNMMMYALMLVVYFGGLIVMSFVLEEIRRQTDNISDVVYAMPWENMSVSNQKTVLLFLMRVQDPMQFVAALGIKAGIRPMISIIKSTFSYYVMLKTTV